MQILCLLRALLHHPSMASRPDLCPIHTSEAHAKVTPPARCDGQGSRLLALHSVGKREGSRLLALR